VYTFQVILRELLRCPPVFCQETVLSLQVSLHLSSHLVASLFVKSKRDPEYCRDSKVVVAVDITFYGRKIGESGYFGTIYLITPYSRNSHIPKWDSATSRFQMQLI
jgi:hypothetical protein